MGGGRRPIVGLVLCTRIAPVPDMGVVLTRLATVLGVVPYLHPTAIHRVIPLSLWTWVMAIGKTCRTAHDEVKPYHLFWCVLWLVSRLSARSCLTHFSTSLLYFERRIYPLAGSHDLSVACFPSSSLFKAL